MTDLCATAVIESLPALMRVGGFDIKIEKWTVHQAAGAARYGEFSSIEQVIRIQLGISSRYKAVDTFLHEVNHALFWAYGIEDEDKEERIVGALGTAWMTLHRDNPWLCDWLKTALA